MNARHLPVGIAIGLLVASALLPRTTPFAASASPSGREPTATRLVEGLKGGSGSTIGPDGALYVTEGVAGRVSRIDPQTGERTTFARGLPKRPADFFWGGPVDVAFLGQTAYVLITLVDENAVVGIYRVDGLDSSTVVADIGTFAMQNPPSTAFVNPRGVQYALHPSRGGFLVTDGHHNRVLRVPLDGEITVAMAFDNIVPTGLVVDDYLVYMAEAGPVPHQPKAGKVVAFGPKAATATEVAAGAPLLVDVEFAPRHQLYALSQGDFSGDPGGAPALPNTGALVKVNRNGGFTVIIDGLNQPTSLEFIKNIAYVVTLTGEVWKIRDISGRKALETP